MGSGTLGSVVIPQRGAHVTLNPTVWTRVSGTPSRANELSYLIIMSSQKLSCYIKGELKQNEETTP